ncbi:MAG: hypothetical protein ACI8RZ_004795 [Myxococcota bacterium]|jgi:hypothetical protein
MLAKMGERTGRLPSELLALPWFDFLLAVRCHAAADQEVAELLKQLGWEEAMCVPNIPVTTFTGGILGAMCGGLAPPEAMQRSGGKNFKMNEVPRV